MNEKEERRRQLMDFIKYGSRITTPPEWKAAGPSQAMETLRAKELDMTYDEYAEYQKLDDEFPGIRHNSGIRNNK